LGFESGSAGVYQFRRIGAWLPPILAIQESYADRRKIGFGSFLQTFLIPSPSCLSVFKISRT